MKANQSISSLSGTRKNILGISNTEPRHYPNIDIKLNDEQKKLLDMPFQNIYNNGGYNHNIPPKRDYKDLYASNISNIHSINNNNIYNKNVNNNDNNRTRNSVNYNSYNEPSLINKIKRNENMKDNTNNDINNYENNNFKNNNILNNDISKSEQNNINFNINNDISPINNKKEEKKDEEAEKKAKENKKQILGEYNILEKVLKDEQDLFLQDSYHTLLSNEFEKFPEELSTYIIDKRVNFPREIYQSFPPLEENKSDQDILQNDSNSDKFTMVFPLLNVIIFVNKNILTFFNYINENSYTYAELTKPVKKLLITIPKPGIFKIEDRFIMICVMEGEIQLLTLTINNDQDDFPIIHKTDFIFSFNETVIDIVSTAKHRIFLSTLNNKIYELDYSINENYYLNFFGPQNTFKAINKEKPIFFGLFTDIKYIFKQSIEIIHKLKVDDTRNILYAIKYTVPKNEKPDNLEKIINSSIIIFDLGVEGKGFTKMTEIYQDDLIDYGMEFGFNNYNYFSSERDLNENNNLIEKSNVIIDIAPLPRDKFKEYHLLVLKRNGHKLFLKFNTYLDESIIKNENELLKFNSSALCKERIVDRFITAIKQIPISKYYNFANNRNPIILYDMINYFPFSTFCYYKIKNINDENFDEYILNVIEDDFRSVAQKENLRFSQNEGLKETEELIFKSNTKTKKLDSIIKLSDYNLEDPCGLGNLLKNSSNNIFLDKNLKYLDEGLNDCVSYNCMNEYAKQLFYSPDEFGMLFSDEFIIFKKFRPIDILIEIIQYKNYKNKLLNENDNIINSSDISNNSAKDFMPNLISNEKSFSYKKRQSLTSFMAQKNKINSPFQINRPKQIMVKFKQFILMHGYIETSIMLLNIITNNNFNYFSRINIYNNGDNSLNNNLQRDYFNPYISRRFKNDNLLMELGLEYFMKLFSCAKEEIDIKINNYQNLIRNLLNILDANKELLSANNNNLRFGINTNNINFKNGIYNLLEFKNFMSYGFILFLSRIIRLFWEETIFIRKKLYVQSDNFDFNIINNLNQNQLMFIKNMLIKLINTINQKKLELLQNASDIAIKSNKLRNYFNDIEQFLNNNSSFTINEIKKKLNLEEQKILLNHKKCLHYHLSSFNFEKFEDELKIVINTAKRFIEILSFIDAVYQIDITKELKRRKSYNILNIKIKDLFRGNYPFVINELLQIIYEFYLTEKNMEFASIKINEIMQLCPNIVDKNDAKAIEGNFILKVCNYNEMDNIDKRKFVQEAIEKINLNLQSVKIKEVVNYLSKFQDIKNIIELCLKKGKILHKDVDTSIEKNKNNIVFDYNNNLSLFNDEDKDEKNNLEENKEDMNKVQNDNNYTEFFNCINIILTILHYLHNSIVCNSFEKYIQINFPKTKFFSCPKYIDNLLSNRPTDDYYIMENIILNLVFKKDYEYIHYNIIEFLKENKMMNKLQEINSPSIENYLDKQINLNNGSPQSLFSMFNFYFRNRNYPCATKILANLINYKNSDNIPSEIIQNDEENKEININYVSLEDRITYVNSMLRTLDLQIKDSEYIQLSEQKQKEIQEAKALKEKMIAMKSILNIQYEIKCFLNTYYKNAFNNYDENNLGDMKAFEVALSEIDDKILDLNELYHKAKQFSIFDSCISIFFQIKFSNTNNKVDTKEIRKVYCDYFCKFDENNLVNWPSINFDRFNRIFNILIKEKTQYQNFYHMLENNGMKNKYRDIIPLELIISIIESMNRKIIFNNEQQIYDEDYYLKKLRQHFSQSENPFWLINYLNEQILLPFSYIFSEYYIIFLSLSKKSNINYNNNINDMQSNRSIINNDNLSINTLNSNNISALNNSAYEEYGLIFDGNLMADPNRKLSDDAKFYCLFLLLGIAKLWVERLSDIINNNNDYYLGNKLKSQDELDLKQFNLEITKNGNQKIKYILKEYSEELKNFKLKFIEQKYRALEKFGEIIESKIIITEEKLKNIQIQNKNEKIKKDEENRENKYKEDKKVLQINYVGDKNVSTNYRPFSNVNFGTGGFRNMMGNN